MLRYLNESYKKIIDDAIDDFFVVDRRHRIVQYNKSFMSIFGSFFTAGKDARLGDMLSGESRKKIESKINAVFRRHSSEIGDIAITNASGMQRYYLASLSPMITLNISPLDNRIFVLL